LAESSDANRLRLGRELRHARKAASRTQKDAAVILRCEQGKISKIEHGTVNVGSRDLDELMHHYQLPDAKKEELRSLHRNSTVPRAVPGYPRDEAFLKLTSFETDAAEILSWHSERVPGPLQHQHYMLKQFGLDRVENRSDVVPALKARASREGVFTVDDPPHYRVVLSESSLYRLPGGWNEKLEQDQIDRFQYLSATYPRLELRILPFTADVPYSDTDFAVLRFAPDDSTMPATTKPDDFVYLEHLGGAQTIGDISKFVEYWELIAAAALDRDETVAFLEWRKKQLKADGGPGRPR
jgi:transcriptional regulator with XRE-family HTH domain